MTRLRDIASQPLGMFLADARLTSAIRVLVAFVAGLTAALGVAPLIGAACCSSAAI